MNFAVLYEYCADKEKIATHRPAHREHLKRLMTSGQLLAAGPLMDDSGSIIVYHASNEHELKSFITSDPFHDAGIFVNWQIKPWKVVFGNRQLLPDGSPP